jgi:hypothetical protein
MKCDHCGNAHANHLWINFKSTRNDEELLLDENGRPIKIERCDLCKDQKEDK